MPLVCRALDSLPPTPPHPSRRANLSSVPQQMALPVTHHAFPNQTSNKACLTLEILCPHSSFTLPSPPFLGLLQGLDSPHSSHRVASEKTQLVSHSGPKPPVASTGHSGQTGHCEQRATCAASCALPSATLACLILGHTKLVPTPGPLHLPIVCPSYPHPRSPRSASQHWSLFTCLLLRQTFLIPAACMGTPTHTSASPCCPPSSLPPSLLSFSSML